MNKNFVQQQADDDDDFVSDAPKQQAAPKQQPPMKRNPEFHTRRKMESVKMPNNKSIGFMSIKSRQCPAKLFNVVKTLSDAQKKDLNRRRKVRELEIDNKTALQITRRSVHDIFGFPMGNIKVEDITRADIRNNITREWRRQYPIAPKGEIQRVFLGALVKQIKKEREGGRMFKMNLLVLLMTLLAEGITNGTSNQNILPCLNNIEDISNMDWCGYLLKCLRKSKLNWKQENKRSWLDVQEVIYVINVTISNINAEKEELDAGGFGTKEFSSPVEQIQKPDASQTDNEDEIGNGDRRGAQPDNGDQFNPYGTQYLIDTIWSDHDTSTGIKEYPYNAEARKVYLESLLARSLCDYPDNEEIKRLNRLEDKEELIIQLGREKFKKKQQTNNMNENETFNKSSKEKWILTPTQTLDDLDFLSQLERDVVATLNARNEFRKRRFSDFEGIGGTRKSNRIPKLSHAHKSPYYKRQLNEEERHRNPNSTSRLFCHTGVMTAEMVKQPLGDFSLFHVFKQEMDRILKTYNEQINEFDMVFFPIILHKHFFLLCFDLKHDCYDIIDNMATGDLFKYENVPIKLKELFMEYLSSMKHPNESTMRNVWPRRLEMAWRTTNNNKDCGVFVMRHMETYDGTTLASWNPGLKPEGAGQDAQLDDLRKKYVTRLLVWKNNILKKKVLAEADIYYKLTPENKEDLNGYALERIEERLALWG
ncbi:ulp1 protease family, C-terminal catalytic domain-containing protein [Tanacetum coccineum]